MQLIAGISGLVFLAVAVFALVALIRPLPRLGMATRKRAFGALTLSFFGFLVAGAILPSENPEEKRQVEVPSPDHEQTKPNAEDYTQFAKEKETDQEAETNKVIREEQRQQELAKNTSGYAGTDSKFIANEYVLIENNDISTASRKRTRLKIFVPTAKSPESLISTSMEAAVRVQREEWSQFVVVFVLATDDPTSDPLAQVDFAPDGCGNSGKDCNKKMWTDARVVANLPTQRQISIFEAAKIHESSFREIVSREIDGNGFEIVMQKLKPLYDELMEFKFKEEFGIVGFGVGGPYNRWMNDVKRHRNETDEYPLLVNWNISFFDLMNLGLEYVRHGKETEVTRDLMERFTLAFTSKSGETQSYEINKEKLNNFLADQFKTTPEDIESEISEYREVLRQMARINLPEHLIQKGKLDKNDQKEQACRWDLQCWGDKNSVDATLACERRIEDIGLYGYEWTDGFLEAKFSHFRWKDRNRGVVTYMGDKIRFQNGFGAWLPHRYWCIYDTLRKYVLDVNAQRGRM